MPYPRWTPGVCLILLLCAPRVNQADEPQFTARPGVLLLRGGRVLRGDIVRVGDRYVVTVGEKDELGVPVSVVELHCDSLEEAYRVQHDALQADFRAAAHLKLADWCLRYEMMAAAAEQLMIAQRLEPENPATAQFEKRLQIAARQPAKPAAALPSATARVTDDQLDEMTQQMPPGTVEQFTNAIQPLLINRCGAGNCHGPVSESTFRLTYPNWSRTLPRRFTQRNLYAAMQFVDTQQPDTSPLLTMSTRAHGGSTQPTFNERDVTQLRQLAEWVHRSAGDIPSEAPENISSPSSILLQPGVPPREPPLDRRAFTSNPPGTPPPNDARPTATPAPPAPTPAGSGCDPFDPEIFNRRYLK